MPTDMFRQQLDGAGLSAELVQRFHERREWSRERVASLGRTFEAKPAMSSLPGLAIYCAGSFARDEASENSDIDLFFILDDTRFPGTATDTNVKSILIMAEIITIIRKMQLPEPSNDGAYLKILRLTDIIDNLGSSTDDFQNFFTARMLLLLESRAIIGKTDYVKVIESVIDTYLRDYKDHVKEFRATFLVNDILRFWKTLCLNYEHKRNQESEAGKIKQKIRNFKLGHSRLLTCFATVALLSSYNTIDKPTLMAIFQMTPTERLLSLYQKEPDIRTDLAVALRLYDHFLSLTRRPPEELEEHFKMKENRAAAFENARLFGDRIYEITKKSAERVGTFRFLVV